VANCLLGGFDLLNSNLVEVAEQFGAINRLIADVGFLILNVDVPCWRSLALPKHNTLCGTPTDLNSLGGFQRPMPAYTQFPLVRIAQPGSA
jgi:hypothetical protein